MALVYTLDDDGVAGWEEPSGGSQPSEVSETYDATDLIAATLTPATLVATPGAGNAIWPHEVFCEYIFGTTPFPTGRLFIRHEGSSESQPAIESFLDATEDQIVTDPFPVGPRARNTFENKALVVATAFPGSIATAIVNPNGMGSNYAVNDTGTIDGGSGGTYRVDAVDGGGAVTAFTVTDAGSGYTLGAHTTTTDGAGSDFQVMVTSADASGSDGDGSVTITLRYEVVTLA